MLRKPVRTLPNISNSPLPREDTACAAPGAGSAHPLILLVEDDPNARIVLQFSLRCKGYSVEEAENGNSAIQKLEQTTPGLVLTDLQMPVMNGIELVQAIRRHGNLRDVPILVMTAFETDLSEEALRSGANDTIQKPIQLPLLFQKIETLLSTNQL
jgi:CheY-like chemotaxis protein